MDGQLVASLTAQAAKSLDDQGRFRMDPPSAPGNRPIITPERALELGRAFLRTWGATKTRTWTEERGRDVKLAPLQFSERVYYAQTPYGPVPDGYHPAYQRLYGPWYILHLSAGGEPEVVLAVSAYGTDLRIDEHGRVRQPVKGGTYFLSVGVPEPGAAAGRIVPYTPEQAAAHAAQATGARVASVPTLVLRGEGWHPAASPWLVTLDRPVRVARKERDGSAGAEQLVHELYVGPGGSLSAPARHQRSSTRIPVLTERGVRGGPPPHAMVNIPRRENMPTALDPVVIVKEGA